jgi:ferredoxin
VTARRTAGQVIRVAVEARRCLGAGQCALTVPEVFRQNDDGISVVEDPEPPAELIEALLLASDICPARAVSVRMEPSLDPQEG